MMRFLSGLQWFVAGTRQFVNSLWGPWVSPTQAMMVREMVTARLARCSWSMLIVSLLACYVVVGLCDLVPWLVPEALVTSVPQQAVVSAMVLKAWIQFKGQDEQT